MKHTLTILALCLFTPLFSAGGGHPWGLGENGFTKKGKPKKAMITLLKKTKKSLLELLDVIKESGFKYNHKKMFIWRQGATTIRDALKRNTKSGSLSGVYEKYQSIFEATKSEDDFVTVDDKASELLEELSGGDEDSDNEDEES